MGIWDIFIALVLLCLFELLKLNSVRAEFLHVWEMLLHACNSGEPWHESPYHVRVAVTDQDDGNPALCVEILQNLIFELRGIVNEED